MSKYNRYFRVQADGHRPCNQYFPLLLLYSEPRNVIYKITIDSVSTSLLGGPATHRVDCRPLFSSNTCPKNRFYANASSLSTFFRTALLMVLGGVIYGLLKKDLAPHRLIAVSSQVRKEFLSISTYALSFLRRTPLRTIPTLTSNIVGPVLEWVRQLVCYVETPIFLAAFIQR